MKKKIILVGTIAVVGLVLGTSVLYSSWKDVAYGPNSISVNGTVDAENDLVGNIPPTSVNKTPTMNTELAQTNIATSAKLLDSAQIDELLEWKVRHGYADFYRDFGRLSEMDLLSLANSGEIGALHILATRYAHKQPDKAIGYYRDAAVHGSTYALILVGELYMFHATDDGLIEDVKSEESASRQALAYNFAAQMLGDNAVSGIQSARIIDTVLGEAMADASVTREICNNAHAILNFIKETRTANGYVPYEQSIAPYSDPVDSSVSAYSFCGGNNLGNSMSRES